MLSRVFLFIASLLAGPLVAQEVLFQHQPDPKSKTRVEAVAMFSRPAPGGFIPVRILVNNGGEQDGKIEISTVCNANGESDGSTLNSSFTLDAPAEKSTGHDILVPCPTLMGYGSGYSSGSGEGYIGMELRMSGSFGAASGSLTTSYAEDQSAVLLSEPLHTKNASMLDSQLSSGSHGRYGGGRVFAGRFAAGSMPEDWRAYSGYDGVGMTDEDWSKLTPGAKNAILRWNRLGGRLVIYALSSSTNFATLGISDSAKDVREADRSFGSVSILNIGPDLQLDARATVDLFSSKEPVPTLISSIRGDFRNAWPLKANFGVQRYNYALFVLILVAFGVLVGPVNLFVFAKSGRRHRLFITTPLIALGTSALLVMLIILIDGFGGRGSRIQLMEIRPDNGENSAYIIQEQISRTGVLTGAEFNVAEPAAITPVVLSSSDNQWARLTDANWGQGMRYEANFRDGKLQVSGDWFQSRSEQGQLVRAVIPTRGRIEARSLSGTPSLISTFDFPIQALFFRDESGGYWRAENIEPGKAFTCMQSNNTEAEAFATKAGNELSVRSRTALLRDSKASSLAARNNHFIAFTEAAPGIETYEGIDWQTTRTYITGPIAKP